MSTESPHVLVIDDDPDIARAARLLLERAAMTVSTAADPAAAWVRLAATPIDVILLDLNFARGRTTGEEGFAMLDRLIAVDRHAVVIVVTGHSGIAVAVQAMRSGASDVVIKPWSNDRLLASVHRAVALRRAKVGTAAAAPAVDGALLGESAGIAHARALIARVAPTDAAVLLHGPAGTGKTLATRLIHRASARSDAPLAVFDAEDADEATVVARLAEAAGATLVIDHVDRLPRAVQADLARGLEGIRVIATTHVAPDALRRAIAPDLLDRIETIAIPLPPLCERGDDAILLARHFLALFAHRHGRPDVPLSDEAARAIAADRWPDNVRGLRQSVERAVLLGRGDAYDVADFAPPPGAADDPAPRAVAADLTLANNEAALVQAALTRHAFNVSRAAAELGLTRAALYRRMARHGF